MNKISFFAVGFEKYICQAIQDAEPLIVDPRVLEEARAFCAQESLHSMAHRKHIKALTMRYPGLGVALDRSIGLYDKLFKERSLKYHLAYIGGLESIFTPAFKLFLDNREALFAKGDAKVGSLFLWHFSEEIEHRRSGLMIYNHVFGNYFFRLGHFYSFMKHVNLVMGVITEEFRKQFPTLPAEWFTKASSHALPLADSLRSILGIALSQMPWHNPDHQPLPQYFHEWMTRFGRGEDMTRTYGADAHGEPPAVTLARTAGES
jgi:predicted metal-dependent hydrolase